MKACRYDYLTQVQHELESNIIIVSIVMIVVIMIIMATLCRPKPREASRPRKQTQGIHKSPRPFFISMLVPFTVVLKVMDFPKEEPTARQQPCTIVRTHEHRSFHAKAVYLKLGQVTQSTTATG